VFDRPVYLDHNATTPTDPTVLEAMLPFFCEHYGNAASRAHRYGWVAEQAYDDAREQVAALIGASRREIVFTSGATESNNLAIKGVAEMYADRGRHIVTVATEHHAVLDPCDYLRDHRGCDVTVLGVDAEGRVDVDAVAEAIGDETILISVMLASNETGTLQPLGDIARIAKDRGVLVHTDAVQAVGRIPVDVNELGVDLLSMSGHKLYGPKGVGALYVRRKGPRVRLSPQMHGGGHERGLRSGTLNTPGIVGMGAACDLARRTMADESSRQGGLRDRLERMLSERIPYIKQNGCVEARLPNTSNLTFAFVEGEALMMKMKTIAVSSGSACSSAADEASHVLRAMGLPEALAHASLRFSLGRGTDVADVDYAVDCLTRAVADLRRISPLYDAACDNGDASGIEWFSGEPKASETS
jgi:cysteine desulfurase